VCRGVYRSVTAVRGLGEGWGKERWLCLAGRSGTRGGDIILGEDRGPRLENVISAQSGVVADQGIGNMGFSSV
jgi:hypothetical protein